MEDTSNLIVPFFFNLFIYNKRSPSQDPSVLYGSLSDGLITFFFYILTVAIKIQKQRYTVWSQIPEMRLSTYTSTYTADGNMKKLKVWWDKSRLAEV